TGTESERAINKIFYTLSIKGFIMKNSVFGKFANLALAFAFAATLGFVGCSNDSTPVASNDDNSSNEQASFVVTDNITTEALFMNGITTDSPEWAATESMRDSRNGRRPDVRRDDLRAILPCLQLTAEQRTGLETLMTAHRDCVKSALDAHKAATQPLRARLQELGKSLREQVKAGTITREDAAAQMRAAQEAVKAQMKAADEALKAALEACKTRLYTQIAGLLTPEQLRIWNNWLATGEVPCPRGPRDGKPRDSVRVRN
ncbi:MAG TPA: hypothetical protein PLI74_04285, partial [Candidatus Kapabacteria bacterium]|nr:hypothetical protein [Candidatus Kapabacteria bacterium]